MDLGAKRTKNGYMGIACNTDFNRTSLLGRFRGLRVQFASLYFIFSRSSSQEVRFSFHRPRGTPKYFEGKEPFAKPRMQRMFLSVARAVLRKKTWDLVWFTARPEALENRVRKFLKLLVSWTEGCPTRMVSSINC